MFTNIKNFFKTTAIYGVVGSVRSFSEFLLLPLYARFLSPEDFGVLDIIMVYVMVGMVIAVLEMNNAAFRFYFDSKDISFQRKIISSAFATTMFLGSIVFLLTIWAANSLSIMFFKNITHSLLFIVAGANIFMSSILTVPANLQRILNKPYRYTSIALFQISLTIGLVIWFLGIKHIGITGILLAKVLATIPVTIISLYWARTYLDFRINYKLLIKMLRYALPLIPVGIAIWGINSINRLFMLHYLSLVQIGYFSLASKFVVVITLTVIAFQLAWPQFAFSNMNSKSAARTFSSVFNVSAALGIWLVIFITMFSGDFINIAMNKAYFPATGAVMPLALGMFFYGVFYFFTTGVVIQKKTLSVIFPIASAVVFNIVLNIIITPVYGFKGTAWVTLSSYFVMAMSMYLLVRNSDYIRLNFNKLLRLGFVSVVYIPASMYLAYENTLSYIVVKAIITAAFPITLWLTGYINKSHLSELINTAKHKLNGKVMFVKKTDEKHNKELSSDENVTVPQEKEVSIR